MSSILRALHVAKGEEGGQRCGLFALAAITFGGAILAASMISILLTLGPGR